MRGSRLVMECAVALSVKTTYSSWALINLALQGRPFAWQEVQILMVYLMQRFTFVLDDPSYDLQLKQTMSIKPRGFYIHAIPRTDKKKSIVPIPTPSSTLLQHRDTAAVTTIQSLSPVDGGKLLYVLYGSNTGTSEAFAQRIATDASAHGIVAP